MLLNKSIITMVVVLSSTTLFQSTPVFAGRQIYPGSQCVRWSGSDVVPRLNDSRIFNDHRSKVMRVDCPILHQNFRRRTGNNLDRASIGIIDAHRTTDARCWSRSVHQTGSHLRGMTAGTRTSSGFGSHEQNLFFPGNRFRVPQAWHYIGCLIPPRRFGHSSGITYYLGQD